MDPNTFPTKGNLIAAKNSLNLANMGYGLMDKKRNILIRELMGMIDEAKGIQSEIDSTFRAAYAALQKANIELGINRWGRVIEEVPYGRDGETVLREVSLRHLEYEEALERLIGSEAMQDYLKKDALLSITLENRGSSDLLLENLQICVDTTLRQCHSQARTEYVSVDGHMCREAHSLGMSVGKYYAIQELLTADPQATLDEFRDKSMKEIKGHTEHCGHKAQETEEKAAEDCHHKGHHGQGQD
jgi:hypothetical protein